VRRAATAVVLLVTTALLLLLTGCSATAKAPPEVRVNAGSETVSIKPTQYCLDGKGQLYKVKPPVVQVDPDMTITLTVPDAVARQGWSVQVWDEKLAQQLGEVSVDRGRAVFQVSSSDTVPPAYYFVVVEKSSSACHDVSGAWPVGFVRSGGAAPSTSAGPSAQS
jgi:Protein of unknown function (DUF2771)